MPNSQEIPVKQLKLDLWNFRMLPQPDEPSSIHAMIMIEPKKFWGLLDSLVATGYLPTENIIVLKDAKGKFIVKEGNRRVACMKLIHKLISDPRISIPRGTSDAIDHLGKDWLKAQADLPCLVYELADVATVDRIVTLAHGKGESASRDGWKSVATARHNRVVLGRPEPALDMLEKYLQRGSNCSKDRADQWGGVFPLTVLEEVLKRIAPLLGEKNGPAIAANYPKIQSLKVVDQIIYDIGMERWGFPELRARKDFFSANYGLVDPTASPGAGNGNSGGAGSMGGGPANSSAGISVVRPAEAATSSSTSGVGAGKGGRGVNKTVPVASPKIVKQLLRGYGPRGKDMHKLTTLADELKALNVEKTPHAFCFMIRGMFEIAAKQYAAANGIDTQIQTAGGAKDKRLISLLDECRKDLTKNHKPHDPYSRELHGSMVELGDPKSMLSIDSLAQLIHNPKFSVKVDNICISFSNVFPLLKELTK